MDQPTTANIIFAIIGMVALVFILWPHPIWVIIDCAISDTYSKSKKIIWIILMFIMWGFLTAIYGVFVTKSRVLKITSIVSVLIVISFFGMMLIVPGTRGALERLNEKLDSRDVTEISESNNINE